jgi:hypothetical protein
MFFFFFFVFFFMKFCVYCVVFLVCLCRGRRDRARVIVGFTTTCAISAYHH